MKGNFWRKALAAALALLIVSGGVPVQPFSQVLERTAITANAEDAAITLIQPTGGTVSYEIREDKTLDRKTKTWVTNYTVYLSNTPDEGYRFVRYIVKDESGNEIYVKFNTNLVTGEKSNYRFAKQTATITAEFEKLSAACAVNVSQTTGGTVSVSTATASEGDKVVLSEQAESGYLFKRFVVTRVSDASEVSVLDESSINAQHSWYFIMPDEAVNVTAVFETAHRITASSVQNGSINVDSLAIPGDTVKFSVSAQNGYEVKNVYVYKTDEPNVTIPITRNVLAWSFSMPDYPVTISAKTEKQTKSIDWNTTHCTVSGPSKGRVSDKITFSVTPEEGYHIRTISVNDNYFYGIERIGTEGGTYTYQMTLGAIKTGNYVVNVVCDNEDEEGFEIAKSLYNHYTDASITNAAGEEITHAEGGERIRIQLLDSDFVTYSSCYFLPKDNSPYGYDNVYTIKLKSDNTLVMPFNDMQVWLTGVAKTYCLTIADGIEHGNVIATDNNASFGFFTTLTISSETGYELTKLIVDGQDVTGNVSNNSYEFSMPAHDVSVSAEFEPIIYSVAFDKNSDDATGTMANQSFTKTAKALTANKFTRTGYTFKGWNTKADGNGDSYSDKQTVQNLTTENNGIVTLYAQWVLTDYNISTEALTNGFISAMVGDTANAVAAHYGDTVTLTVTPDEGYVVKSVSVNGEVIEPVEGVYSFKMPAEDVNVSAEFEKAQEPVTYIGENGEEVTVTDYTVLTGNETANDDGDIKLQGGTYVVDKTLIYSNMLMFRGDAMLILKDDVKLTLNMTNENKNGITCYDGNNDCSLSVYGQSNGTGELDVSVIGYRTGISCANYKQYGGKVTATAVNHTGINAYYDFMIYGGELTAKSAEFAAINSSTGCIYFNGGTVSATTASSQRSAIELSSYNRSVYFNGGTVTLNGRLIMNGTCYLNGGIVKANSYDVYSYSITGTYSNGTNLYTGEYNFQNHPSGDWWTAFNAELVGKTLAPAYVVNLPESTTSGSISADKSFVTANAADKTVTLTVTPDEGYAVKSVSVNGTAIEPVEGVYSFTMPAEDVTVSAEFEKAQEPVTYLDENGVEQTCTNYTVLDNTMTSLGTEDQTTWYVVKDSIEFDEQTVNLKGDVHIILCDDKTMKFECAYRNIYGGNLTIYGQSSGTGKLDLICAGQTAIVSGSITINGGIVIADAGENDYHCGIEASGNVIINGGTVSVTGNGYGIVADDDVIINGGSVSATGYFGKGNGIAANGNVIINGGSVSASAKGDGYGIKAGKDIILGGAEIKSKSYNATDTVKVKDGMVLTDGTQYYFGTLTGEQISAIANKTLVRAYAVNLPESTTGGSISADKSFVAANAEDKTVTLTVTPDEGYAVKSVSVNGEVIEPVEGVYSFEMPAEDVTVSAEFEESKTEPITTQISYVTANGQASEEVTAIVLDENTVIDEDFDWSQPVYYVTGDVVYSEAYFMFSNPNGATLILADDANLNVGEIMTYHRYEDNSLESGAYDVIITKPAGAEGVGKISSQIICKNYTQYAGQVTGFVGAFGDSTGEDADYQGTITLDFADESASANIVTYYEEMRLCSSVIIPDGKALTDGTNTYTGIITGDDLKAISGQTLVAAEVENTRNIVNAANITLGGELGLNFYLTIPDDAVTAGAKVVMNGPEGEKEVVLSSLTKDDKGRYKVTYKIKAVYINENVSLNVTDSDGNTLDLFKASGSQVDNNTLVYSIYDYVQSAKADTALTEKEHNMVDTMYTYGAYSAKWFNGTALPDDVNELNDLNMSDYEKYKLQTDGSSSSITLTGLSLILDSNTALRLYFTSADDTSGHSAKIDDVDITIHPTETAGKYYVEIDDISANNLISNYSIVFDGTYIATVSTMTYVYNSLKNGTTDDVMNVLKALCAYSDAVNKS